MQANIGPIIEVWLADIGPINFATWDLFLYLHNGDNNVSFWTSKDQNSFLYLDIRTKHRLLQGLVVFFVDILLEVFAN